MYMIRRRFIKSTSYNFSVGTSNRTNHFCNFFRAFINKQNDQISIRVILFDSLSNAH